MLEYLFFTQEIADKFIRFLHTKNLDWTQKNDPMLGSIVIETSEDIEDDVWDALDDYHDKLSEEEQKTLELDLKDNQTEMNAAGIYIQLGNGEQTVAQVDPEIMNRMLTVISMDEFNSFIETIVSSVENPNDAPICQKK